MALAARDDAEVTLLAAAAMMKKRSRNGWMVPELKNVRLIIRPENATVKKIIHISDKESLHIFHGMHYPRLIPQALNLAIRDKRRIAIWSEPYQWKGPQGYIRYLRSIYHRIRYNDGISFMLSTGSIGSKLLLKAGHPREKIFEWGYFTETVGNDAVTVTPAFSICYVGHLIKRKGVDLLLKAVAQLEYRDICVNIVGEGPCKKELEGIIRNLELKNVHLQSFMHYDDARRFMEEQDLLVLPSRLDGWGAVVNEALMQGTPVICSDDCGSSILLNGQNSSSVFESGSVKSLAKLLEARITLGKVEREERNRIREWAKCISTESAVSYFLKIAAHRFNNEARPLPPWRAD